MEMLDDHVVRKLIMVLSQEKVLSQQKTLSPMKGPQINYSNVYNSAMFIIHILLSMFGCF